MSPRMLSLTALAAVAGIWGGAVIIATMEQALPLPRQWLGHAAFHIWTAAIAAAVAVMARNRLRLPHQPRGVLRPLLVVTTVVAVIAAVTSLLDAVGAYPTLRAFHDAVNTVARPSLWLLTATLVLVAVSGVVSPRSPVGTDRLGEGT